MCLFFFNFPVQYSGFSNVYYSEFAPFGGSDSENNFTNY